MWSPSDNPQNHLHPVGKSQHDSKPELQNQWGSREIVSAFEINVPLLIEILTHHWNTGQGTRVRHVLWSLYTCSHLMNLGDACSGLDDRVAEALATAVAARLIVGPAIEPILGEILRTSGEFDRFNQMDRATPDHLPVIYPPAPADARALREMANALDHLAKNGQASQAGE